MDEVAEEAPELASSTDDAEAYQAPAPAEFAAEEPAVEEAVEETLVVEQAEAEEPVAETAEAEEAVAEYAAAEVAVEETTAEEPVAEAVAEPEFGEEYVAGIAEPIVEEPVAEEPVAEEPLAEEPLAEEPADEPEPAREGGSIDQAEMRRRIEETRARLKAKAFDAMMSGESALLRNDSGEKPVPRGEGADLEPEIDSSINESLSQSDD